MKTLVITTILILGLLSCNSESPAESSSINLGFDPIIITGIVIRDHNGRDQGLIGSPNIRLSTGSPFQRDGAILSCFPNPIANNFGVFLNISNTQKVRIFLVKAGSSKNLSNIFGVASVLQNPNQKLIETTQVLAGGQSTSMFDVSNLEPGFYRLYVVGQDFQLWDNIYIESEFGSNKIKWEN